MSSRMQRIKDANARQRLRRKNRGQRRRGLLVRLLRFAVLGTVVGGLGTGLAAAGGYQILVGSETPEHIQRDHILEIIAQESPVLYRDGQTRLGVFFAREHRDYVPFDEIPQAWVDAIVAAEDQRFFDHYGVDPLGIARAMLSNIRAGRVVAGGSTLTQQTAKNLYYRPDRSLRSKLVELVDALRLEAEYEKTDILEFYANQFHVSANGRGLGIAARYFFDKEVSALTTLECAFLAGLVKAPAAYNPFVGSTEERRQGARERAKARTRYVLDRLLAMDKLTAAEHAQLVAQDIPFKRGTFRYDSSVLLDEVAARLEQAPFPQLFAELGIDNPSTAGIEVVTTLDPAAQRGATHALWHHLTAAGSLMEGATLADFRLPDDRAPHPDPDQPPVPGDFTAATVLGRSDSALRLDLGGPTCIVDKQGLQRVADILRRAEAKSAYVSASAAQRNAVRDGLPDGAVVWASLRTEGVCDLERRPELQGAVLLLEEGRVRAMVGGNDNRNFNRAITAKRQLGSTWKPLVYSAALHLGWSPADLLENRTSAFVFEGSWYYPRADHASTPLVTLHQAGTASENISSIWLLSRLLDRLSPEEFFEVATLADLVPREGEERLAWIERIRDEFGVISTPGRVPELAFVAARQEVLESLDLDETEAVAVRSLHFGRGADKERRRLQGQGGSSRARKLAAVDHNYLRLQALAEVCTAQAQVLAELGEAGRKASEPGGFFSFLGSAEPVPVPPAANTLSGLRVAETEAGLVVGCGEALADGQEWTEVTDALLATLAAGEGPVVAAPGSLVLDRGITAGTLAELARVAQRRALVLEAADLWSVEALQHHPDYRTLVAVRYVSAYARLLGVETDLPPVLSLPLGAVDISLEEATSLYSGLVTGSVVSVEARRPTVPTLGLMGSAPTPDGSTLLIQQIRDREGAVLYEASTRRRAVVPEVTGALTGDILRSVVQYGTGRRARGAASVEGVAVPLAGKTGTTNGFRNAAFLGMVPRATDTGWDLAGGYTLGVYVGYDDNRPMVRGRARLAGSSGALPVWMGTARALADAGLLGATAPPPELVLAPAGVSTVPLDPKTGLVVPESSRRAWVFGEGVTDEGLEVDRLVTPFDARGQDVSDRSAWLPVTVGEAVDSEAADLEGVWLDEMDAPSDAPAPAADGAGAVGGPPDPDGAAGDPAPEEWVPEDLPLEDLELEVVPRIAPP